MCLRKLGNFKISNYWGWQLFKVRRTGELQPYLKGPVVPGGLKEGTWTADPKRFNIQTSQSVGEVYPTGHHIYVNKKSAENRLENIYGPHRKTVVARKVLFTEVVAEGIEFYGKVAVARQRYIVPEEQ